jgi:hypothetical protein
MEWLNMTTIQAFIKELCDIEEKRQKREMLEKQLKEGKISMHELMVEYYGKEVLKHGIK